MAADYAVRLTNKSTKSIATKLMQSPHNGVDSKSAFHSAEIGFSLPALPVVFDASAYLNALSISAIFISILGLILSGLNWVQFRNAKRYHRRVNGAMKNLKAKIKALEVMTEHLQATKDFRERSTPKPLEQDSNLCIDDHPTKIIKGDTEDSQLRLLELDLNKTNPATEADLATISQEITISDLINAVNTENRRLVKQHTTSELNITQQSEKALVMRLSKPTQLEKVPGGGSYLLIEVGGSYHLFPTTVTLRGFEISQPDKGLYSYENQIISSPQLIEPALLRQDGNLWTVETLGRVAIP